MPLSKTGGAGRDRTGDLLNANQALSQLSYSPILESSAALCPTARLSSQRLSAYHGANLFKEIKSRPIERAEQGQPVREEVSIKLGVENTESNGVERLLSTC